MSLYVRHDMIVMVIDEKKDPMRQEQLIEVSCDCGFEKTYHGPRDGSYIEDLDKFQKDGCPQCSAPGPDDW